MGFPLENIMRVITTISALYMCASPASNVFQIHLRRDVGNASLLPFATLWVCNHIWMLYGYVTGNMFPVFATYAIGDALSIIFLAVYIRWTTERKAVFKTCAIALFCNAVVTAYVILGKNGGFRHSQQTMTLTIGVSAIVSSLALYASPLAAVKIVLQTRSSASLPFGMILAGTINNLLWVGYGVLVYDLFVIVPTSVNAALGLVQVALYGVYYPSHSKAGGAIATPDGELSQISYLAMGSVTPLSIANVKQGTDVCVLMIEEPCQPEENR
ncbi:unnamed protein product [Peronospora belbahrii]|uniref:Bidirectional sugar transporter SWEET n=1 Tax=Peronospora belbahrii TaxID=622444 RepID=A0AAU9L762_9STRA|nr:unnamed protein product [Peronospora belbahrii]CAH0522123.1 unnamed protein product [Peronospora belbahrii]